jgi:hypothetical protein
MGIFALTLLGFAVGAALRFIGFGRETLEAQKEKARLTGDAEADAAAALRDAEIALERQVGQLGTEFASYDAWYNVQVEEWNQAIAAGDFGGSLTDYIRREQLDELGRYGIERATLETEVEIARQQLALAREDIAEQYGFGVREYDAGVTASHRVHQGEGAAAAAMGIRGGTIATTVVENQRVRMEALDLYLDRLTWQRDRTVEEVGIAETRVSRQEQIGIEALQQELVGARQTYSFNVEDIGRELEQYTTGLQAEFDRSYNFGNWMLETALGGVQGAQFGLQTYNFGVQAGAWGYDAKGQFWSNLNLPTLEDLRLDVNFKV